MDETYDAVVVGARCAGAATAMLMARTGMRVLLLDRADPRQDTLSTHALMRGGVLQLRRWGLLDRIVAAGTPPVHATTFHYGDRAETVALTEPLYAPRRTVLDAVLLDAARESGAEVRTGYGVTALSKDPRGRVTGVRGRVRGGGGFAVRAGITIGADGVGSTVARLVDAGVTRQGTEAGGLVYGYWPVDDPALLDGYHWYYRTGATAGLIPTNDGLCCVWAGMPAARFAGRRAGPPELFADVLADAAPELASHTAAEPHGRLRGFPGMPAHLRRATGPGWALVGDAGYFKDPLAAHGITDALRDAELLARAVEHGAPGDYERTRDELAHPLLDAAEVIASYRWDVDSVRDLLLAESAAMKPEVAAIRAFDLDDLQEVA